MVWGSLDVELLELLESVVFTKMTGPELDQVGGRSGVFGPTACPSLVQLILFWGRLTRTRVRLAYRRKG